MVERTFEYYNGVALEDRVFAPVSTLSCELPTSNACADGSVTCHASTFTKQQAECLLKHK